MDVATQKKNAKAFIEEWTKRGHERQDSQSFWLSLLREVLGVEEPEKFIKFEKKVMLTHDSFIDGYIEQTHVLIEQKSSNKDLDKPIRQSKGGKLTPFQQAFRYASKLPYSQRPRWIVTCNFKEFRVYDMEHLNSEPAKIELNKLDHDYYRLEFLVDKSNQHLEKEKQVSLSAGELVGQIYDELLKQYKDPDNEHSQKSINQLCVRIVFCLYAEDAGIFGKRNMFHDYLEQFDTRQMRQALIKLFKVLDTKEKDRDSYLADDDPKLAEFPYVNGGMFSNEDIEIPSFTDELHNLLLSKASDEFDWSEISPTIFGAVFESTLNPETRRQGGMHYTSVENIHKVIDPLFLNDLKNELNEIEKTKQLATLKKKARKFQEKLANLTFFDPACGSGNFLTETYLQLRKLENEAIKLIYPNPSLDVGQAKDIIKVSIQQFYGIEINDFAVSVAKTALWIAESQMLEETKDIFYAADWDFLPLKTYTHIHEGNALTMDWNDVIPNYACCYIMGNPPFIGKKEQNKVQKQELKDVFKVESKDKSISVLDYVCGWYKKASDYIEHQKTQVAFVSTNSISQGEQVAPLWKHLKNITINFARRTFAWDSEAKDKAHVHVIIIGFSNDDNEKREKFLFSVGKVAKVKQISPYLVDYLPKDVVISKCKSNIDKKAPEMHYGSMPIDKGFLILNKKDVEDIAKEGKEFLQFIKPYTGGKEIINNKYRWCIWLKDASPSQYRKSKFIVDRINKTKSFRKNSGRNATKKLADTPYLFGEIRQPKSKMLVFPKVSSEKRRYIPIPFVDPNIIVNGSSLMIANATNYHFGILESNVHMAWMRVVAGRMKSDYQYSKELVYTNFPWPSPTDKQKRKIEKTAQAILDARALYPDSSLADLYDPITMSPELIKAHQDNDRAVMAAYGLPVKGTTESDAVAHLFKMYEKLTNKK
ncbi:class I SAM-dependent DNA methyltransferase [Lactobacillus helveticus]|uniref:class I SAM-dependent DNA methyltransferase n=1 Tax=Lactobacillus helveticus TaxID=1587 RepID=UPI0015639357|nr:class I SAM-dependent DNA methyltransferase [Lactobacillus helveticus]NRO45414.1 hypothetical protein [Lactobacillus helveticus]